MCWLPAQQFKLTTLYDFLSSKYAYKEDKEMLTMDKINSIRDMFVLQSRFY